MGLVLALDEVIARSYTVETVISLGYHHTQVPCRMFCMHLHQRLHV